LVAVTQFRIAGTAALALLLWGSTANARAPDLHSQSAAAVLRREFSDPGLSFLLLNEKGEVIAQRWAAPERETPVGSLIKPFLAVAYGRTHDSFPVFHCHGKKTCWLPRGHGELGVTQAIAVSCNSYFHQLLSEAEPGFAAETLQSYGLTLQDSIGGDKVELFEKGLGWQAAPLQLAHAYLDLLNGSEDKSVSPVLKGMALSARSGTASAVDKELNGVHTLAKTGTAPCVHRKKAPGDGLALVMFPADHPRLILLVRVHGKPGSAAAAVAGRMIAAVEKNGSHR
jgi:Penicillin binding protein transpeptidase domain